MVSIITCIFNQNPSYFKESIKSVDSQDGPIEWIVVDDGSDKNYFNKYKDYLLSSMNNHKYKLIRLSQNMGLSYARNVGIKLAEYDWIVVLDSDDLLAPSISRKITSLPSNIALVACSVKYFNERTTEYRPIMRWRNLYMRFGQTFADPFLWFDFYYHGIIAKKSLLEKIGGYRNDLKLGEDQDILLRACEAIEKKNVYFLEDIGYYYRNNQDGVCMKYWPFIEKKYCITMAEASRRRGSKFIDCKFLEKSCMDGAMIDTYAYKENNRWFTWSECVSRYFSIT